MHMALPRPGTSSMDVTSYLGGFPPAEGRRVKLVNCCGEQCYPCVPRLVLLLPPRKDAMARCSHGPSYDSSIELSYMTELTL